MPKKTALITGITGQDGAYLSKLLLGKNYNVVGSILSPNYSDMGNLEYLQIKDRITLEECDLLDSSQVKNMISKYKPDEIYHLAAQSSVGVSFEQPSATFRFNTISILNVVESVRTISPLSKVLHPSSGEVYGNSKQLPMTEQTLLDPLSPYAVSKVASQMLVGCYRDSYKIFACNAVLFNHESYLRPKNFFVKKIIQQSLELKHGKRDKIHVGNIDVKRDLGYAPDYVEAMWLMLQNDKPMDLIICSGKAVSLRQIVNYVFEKLNIDSSCLVTDPSLYRPADVLEAYGDNSKIKKTLGWTYNKSFFEVIDILIEEETKNMEGTCAKKL